MRSGINRRVEQPRVDLAGDGVDAADALDLVPEQLNAHRGAVLVGGENLHHVAAHAEIVAVEADVAAAVLHSDQTLDELLAREVHPRAQRKHLLAVFLRVAERKDAGD